MTEPMLLLYLENTGCILHNIDLKFTFSGLESPKKSTKCLVHVWPLYVFPAFIYIHKWL